MLAAPSRANAIAHALPIPLCVFSKKMDLNQPFIQFNRSISPNKSKTHVLPPVITTVAPLNDFRG